MFTIVPYDIASFDDARIGLVSLETGQIRVLLEGGTNPLVVSTGHLLYVRGASLIAVPFDPRRLQVTGQSVAVVDGIMTDGTDGNSTFAIGAGGSLAYVRGGVAATDRRVVWVDRHGRIEPLIDVQRAFSWLRLSPDRKWLAVTIGAANDQVWLYDLGRRTLRRLTSEWDNQVISWTPDGKHIVFRCDRPNPGKYRWMLYRQTLDGSTPELLSLSGAFGNGAWSRDGKMFVFTELRSFTDSDISLLTLDSPNIVRPLIHTSFTEADPSLSPDGHWIAYASNESGDAQVYVQRFPELGAKWQISADGGLTSVWDHQGRELFYQNGNKLMAVDIQTRPGPAFAAGTPRLLFEGSFVAGQGNLYDVAPDGRFIMIEPGQSETPATHVALVQNWFEELKRLVPTG